MTRGSARGPRRARCAVTPSAMTGPSAEPTERSRATRLGPALASALAWLVYRWLLRLSFFLPWLAAGKNRCDLGLIPSERRRILRRDLNYAPTVTSSATVNKRTNVARLALGSISSPRHRVMSGKHASGDRGALKIAPMSCFRESLSRFALLRNMPVMAVRLSYSAYGCVLIARNTAASTSAGHMFSEPPRGRHEPTINAPKV